MEYAGVEGIAQLWCSGSRILHLKIPNCCENAIYHLFTALPRRFPALLKELPRLRAFRFFAEDWNRAGYKGLNREYLQSLSPTLEEITFICPEWSCLWQTSTLDPLLPVESDLTVDLSVCYPNLTKLHISGGDSSGNGPSFFPLPPLMTDLNIVPTVDIPGDNLDTFPTTLTSLHLSILPHSNHTFLARLPNLTSLGFGNFMELTEEVIQSLPPNLTRLKLECSRIQDCKSFFSTFTSLTDLHLVVYNTPLNVDMITLLPPRLTQLTLYGTLSNPNMEWERELSPNLKSLVIVPRNPLSRLFGNPNHISLRPGILPRALENLKAPADVFCKQSQTDPFFSGFPRSLTALEVGSSDGGYLDLSPSSPPRSAEGVAFLPPQLITLKLDPPFDWTPECLSLLPRSITHLAIVGTLRRPAAEDFIEEMNAGVVQELPQSMERLAKSFPPKIRSLTFQEMNAFSVQPSGFAGISLSDLLVNAGHHFPSTLDRACCGPQQFWRVENLGDAKSGHKSRFLSLLSSVKDDDAAGLEQLLPLVGTEALKSMDLTPSAAMSNSLCAMKWLVAHGCDPRQGGALRSAAYHGSFAVLEWLVDSCRLDLFESSNPEYDSPSVAAMTMTAPYAINLLDWMLKRSKTLRNFTFHCWDFPIKTPLQKAIEIGSLPILDWFCNNMPEVPNIFEIRDLISRLPKERKPTIRATTAQLPPAGTPSNLPASLPAQNNSESSHRLWNEILSLGKRGSDVVFAYITRFVPSEAAKMGPDHNDDTFAHFMAKTHSAVPPSFAALTVDWLGMKNKDGLTPLDIAEANYPQNKKLLGWLRVAL
jgi:hypothetical protein